jgi:acyl-CoA reductase-like NAD-dependent aldehyde dehydrogenase
MVIGSDLPFSKPTRGWIVIRKFTFGAEPTHRQGGRVSAQPQLNLDPARHRVEIFGPVLTVINVDTLESAIELVNRNNYGNGSSIFTNSGATARVFERTIQAGQIGINVPIPVPLPMFSWSGNKGSVLGGHSLYGKL